MKPKVRRKQRRQMTLRAYASIGSHGCIFMFFAGDIADRYPTLLHIYKDQVTKDLVPVKITYTINNL